MKKTFFFSFITLLTFGACDKIDAPLDDGAQVICDPAVLVPRKILVEDLTGHRCNNCPAAARTAEEIHDFFEGNTVTVGVHVTSTFAAPILMNWSSAGVPENSFTTDFRTDAGNSILSAYPPTGLPAGIISRKDFNGSIVQGAANWFSAVGEIVCKQADARVTLDDITYDPTNRSLNATVNAELFSPLNGTHTITILLTEDHIIDWQKDNTVSPEDIEDYDHRHVLRDKIDAGGNTSALGATVLTTNANPGDLLTTSVSGYIVNDDWEISNCYLVAFLSAPDGEVLQVEEVKILP